MLQRQRTLPCTTLLSMMMEGARVSTISAHRYAVASLTRPWTNTAAIFYSTHHSSPSPLTAAIRPAYARLIVQIAPRLWHEVVALMGGLIGTIVTVVFAREPLDFALAGLAIFPGSIVRRVRRCEHGHDQNATQATDLLTDKGPFQRWVANLFRGKMMRLALDDVRGMMRECETLHMRNELGRRPPLPRVCCHVPTVAKRVQLISRHFH